MTKSILLGAALGGLTAFAWSMLSWEIIGWHEKAMSGFGNQDAMAAAIAANAPRDGTYMLPAAPPAGLSQDQKKKADDAAMERYLKGPIVIAAVRKGGFGSFGQALVLQFLTLSLGALLLTWLLAQARGLSYARRVLFVATAGVASSVLVDLPNWNWWGFSGAYTAVNLADSAITWAVAGLAIAAVCRSNSRLSAT